MTSDSFPVEVRTEWLAEGGDQARLLRAWPASAPVASLVLVHGYAEHSGRYDAFARRLAAKGISVLAPDLSGHGRSGGERARVESFDALLEDSRRALARAADGGVKPFLFGHSMGGLVALGLSLAEQERLAGLILSGPAIGDPGAIDALLALDPFPELVLDSTHLSRDPEVCAAYDRDPLNYRGPMPRPTVATLVAGARSVRERWQHLRLPLLALHGGDDALVPARGSEELYASVASSDKELAVLPGLRHEILNEPEGPEIADRIAYWILRRVEGERGVC
mgnify:CR=1 FL=1